jgi:hypothetical protein
MPTTLLGLPGSHSPAGTDPNTAAGGAMAYWNGKRDGDLGEVRLPVWLLMEIRMVVDAVTTTTSEILQVRDRLYTVDTLIRKVQQRWQSH